jgi:CSLREA domain-containing protein
MKKTLLIIFFLTATILPTTDRELTNFSTVNNSNEALVAPGSEKTTNSPPKQYESLASAIAATRFGWERREQSTADDYLTFNYKQQLEAQFNEIGLHLLPIPNGNQSSWNSNLQLSEFGYGESLRTLSPAGKYNVSDNRIESRLLVADSNEQELTEWYLNRPEGIEQGFTLNAPPSRDADIAESEPLRLKLKLAGDLQARRNDESIELCDAAGETVLHYSKLTAEDATGRKLSAEMEVSEDGEVISLVVSDGGAIYPLTIDPLITQAEGKLIPDFNAAGEFFGRSVALSSDTAAVAGGGGVYIFTSNGTTWSFAQKLTASNGAALGEVVIRDNIIVAGAPFDDTPAGADAGSVFIFFRTNGIWAQDQKIVASDGAAGDNFGSNVDISGNIIVVGAPKDDTPAGIDTGSVYVFDINGMVWVEQQKLNAVSTFAFGGFGENIGVSGTTIAIAAQTGFLSNGKAYIYTRTNSTWTLQQELTLDSYSRDGDIDIVGNTVAIGDFSGSIYVFTRNGSTWTLQQQVSASPLGGDFGRHIDIDDLDARTIVAGGFDSNQVSVFKLNGATWTEQEILDPGNRQGVPIPVPVIFSGTIIFGIPTDDTTAGVDSGSVFVYTLDNGTWVEQPKLIPSYERENAQAGYSVAIDGDTAVVGAWRDTSQLGTAEGAAYVYKRAEAGWRLQQKLTSMSGIDGGSFGFSTAIDGNTIAIGAKFDTGNFITSGAAYVYVFDGVSWNFQQKLVADDGFQGDELGFSIALEGNTIIAGAWKSDTAPLHDSGSAYIFTRNGTVWTQQQKLAAPNAQSIDRYGASVGISGNTIVVGSLDESPGGFNNGSAYVYVQNGNVWTEQQKLAALDGAPVDLFGASVAISGNTIAVGAYEDDDLNGVPTGISYFDSGSAYVFVRNGNVWTEQQKLTASDGNDFDWFGYSIAIDGDTIVVGAENDDSSTGSAYVFTRSGTNWSQKQKTMAYDGTFNDYFGAGVGVSGNAVIVGAWLDNSSAGPDSGSAYIYRLSACTTPELVTNPASQAVCAGTNVRLAVSAQGDGLIYQWRKNGNDIPGANAASYLIANASTNDAGSYDVIISGSCGMPITSTAANLTVTPNSIAPTSQNFPASGGVGSINITSSPNCGWTAVPGDGWITITGDAGGTGDGSVSFSVAANNGLTARTGTIRVAGQTFTVSQAARASLVVTRTDDRNMICNSGVDCSLREAINSANNTVGADQIVFSPAVFNAPQIIDLINGELQITDALIIAATPANALTVRRSSVMGMPIFRVFNINSIGNVTLNRLTITNGSSSDGGGILKSGGILTLNDCVITGNQATVSGGGIKSDGVIILNGTSVIANNVNGLNPSGGGIAVNGGTATLNNSTVFGNSNSLSGGGGEGLGGGIAVTGGGTLNINNSTVSGNTADTNGSGKGGGILLDINDANALNVVGSTISGNTTCPATADNSQGGGLWLGGGIVTIRGSVIFDNNALHNGGASGSGGGILNGSNLNIFNSTISGNKAVNNGGGISQALQASAVTVLNNVTITKNSSNLGGGVTINNGTPVMLRNTIIAGNLAVNNPNVANAGFISNGNNLIGDAGNTGVFINGANGDQVGTAIAPLDPQLAPLGMYGGTTLTHALLVAATAKDNGNNCVFVLTCAANNPLIPLTFDQRSAPRQGNAGDAVDIGAFESTPGFVAVLPMAVPNQPFNVVIAPDNGNFNFVVANGALPPGLILNANFAPNADFSLKTDFAPNAVVSISGTTAAGTTGTYNFTIMATGAGGGSVSTNYSISVLGPTAARVSIGGRIFADNRAVSHMFVTLTESDGVRRTAITNSFGYYRFDSVQTGGTYILSVNSKRYSFMPRVVSVIDSINDLDFTAEP